jgi:hypothetical protein
LWAESAGEPHLPGTNAAHAGSLCWLTLLGRAVVCAVLVVLAGGAITQLSEHGVRLLQVRAAREKSGSKGGLRL